LNNYNEAKLSLLGKRWVIQENSEKLGLFEKLLKIRGVTNREAFLHPQPIHSIHDLKDLEKAAQRIRTAIEQQERILIVGDYDADGVTASVILYKVLKFLEAEVSVRLPNRVKHGYGLNAEFIREAKELGVKLIITVDNGISAKREVELANQLGIDVVITDHHLPPSELPPAFAIVNPRQSDCAYAYKDLAGAGVAYFLALSLAGEKLPQDLRDELVSFAAIGTLADVCPLTGENRAIVSEGLQKITKTKNVGLRRILENARIEKEVTAEDIGFRIAPRLNAAGRLEDAIIAFHALSNGGGKEFADQLEKLNIERQKITGSVSDEVEERLGEITDEKILIASSSNWQQGIIGLTAGKLAEKYYRPVILMSEVNGVFTGSCRSPLPEFNITAALNEVSDLLETFGGHRAAAGFTLLEKNRAEFQQRMEKIAKRELGEVNLTPTLLLDTEILEEELIFDLLREVAQLSPFGMGNPEPILFWEKALLGEIRAVGNGSKHLQIKLGKSKIPAIGFGIGDLIEELKQRKEIDLAFSLSENEWNGKKTLQLRIVDLR
jgi:single-stranded-DNA-specific exonuclease